MDHNKSDLNKFFNEKISCKILVVGDCMLDQYIFGLTNRLSPEAPVPIFIESSIDRLAGGAANVAMNLSAIGCEAVLCGIIGDDPCGRQLEEITSCGGLKSNLVVSREKPTITKTRIISRGQQIVRIDRDSFYTENDIALLMKTYIEQLPKCDVVIFSDYNKSALANIQEMIKIARQQKKKSIVDPKQNNSSVYGGATMITPNREEFALMKKSLGLFNESSEKENAKAIIDALNIESLLITKSELGMTLYMHNGDQINFPSSSKAVRDVIGAGDTSVAVLARSLSLNIDIKTAAYLSNHAAGIVVGKPGTSTVSLHEIQKSLESVQ